MSALIRPTAGAFALSEIQTEEGDKPPLRFPERLSPNSKLNQLSSILVSQLPSYMGLPSQSPCSSAMLSRRSSSSGTSKSVHWNESPTLCETHSADLYDRSPILCTGQDASLEIPSCKKGATEGWIRCMERARAISHVDPEITPDGKTVFPRASPTDSHPSTPRLTALNVDDLSQLTVANQDAASVMARLSHRRADSDEGHSMPPALIQDDSSGSDSDELMQHSAQSEPYLFPMDSPRVRGEREACGGDVGPEDEEEEEEEEDSKKIPRFGLCALGKWSRDELYSSLGDDCLAGF